MPSKPPPGRPFQKGQSGNPSGRPRKDASIDAWRSENAAVLRDAVTPDEVKDIWLRWISRFRAGDPKALWLVPYLFGQPPKPVEPKDPEAADARPVRIVFKEMAARD